mmetsp:Transcript_1177/g.2608  ORF Transcript_1177/g.2608 Transcript_1177/m.2608 type:complete len:260 (+) Transcript_1177:232-1011(+)
MQSASSAQALLSSAGCGKSEGSCEALLLISAASLSMPLSAPEHAGDSAFASPSPKSSSAAFTRDAANKLRNSSSWASWRPLSLLTKTGAGVSSLASCGNVGLLTPSRGVRVPNDGETSGLCSGDALGEHGGDMVNDQEGPKSPSSPSLRAPSAPVSGSGANLLGCGANFLEAFGVWRPNCSERVIGTTSSTSVNHSIPWSSQVKETGGRSTFVSDAAAWDEASALSTDRSAGATRCASLACTFSSLSAKCWSSQASMSL